MCRFILSISYPSFELTWENLDCIVREQIANSHFLVPSMPRPENDQDALTESELAELRRNLSMLSGPSVEDFYRHAHKDCSLERKPGPKAMQSLVTGVGVGGI